MASATSVLEREGPAALKVMTAEWTPEERQFLSISPVDDLSARRQRAAAGFRYH
ncbi:hypothetical protein WDV93_12100 [Pantoea ananatis]